MVPILVVHREVDISLRSLGDRALKLMSKGTISGVCCEAGIFSGTLRRGS
jgi:hypothetical protein